jgi:hypothetical protein
MATSKSPAPRTATPRPRLPPPRPQVQRLVHLSPLPGPRPNANIAAPSKISTGSKLSAMIYQTKTCQTSPFPTSKPYTNQPLTPVPKTNPPLPENVPSAQDADPSSGVPQPCRSPGQILFSARHPAPVVNLRPIVRAPGRSRCQPRSQGIEPRRYPRQCLRLVRGKSGQSSREASEPRPGAAQPHAANPLVVRYAVRASFRRCRNFGIQRLEK